MAFILKSFSYKPQTLAFTSQSRCESLLKSKKRFMIPFVNPRNRRSRIHAAQSNFFRAYKVGKDGVEAGTTLVPESVPRPIARISVAVVGAAVVLFFVKSFLSTAFFFLATMGLIYSAFIAFNKDDGPTTGGSDTTSSSTATTASTDEETLEEARRIMEKYK
ncbi:uncharacterized protein LOC110910465 isoform X2 [Helianthus annuus]|uniref:uncharacterized protein LOC110910465 isoform X2 n=1 Tax=Helianthus annuus TaxID=4232 RepID=UPI001652D646|nr:uncharacterized protein LOC110910465 isoform X2 [Helianthus annuus]